MVTRVAAFDIDGTLTDPKVRDIYERLSESPNVSVGIITSNPPFAANSFISEHNLETDFRKSALVKTRAMLQIQEHYSDADFIYVGDRYTDEFYTNVSGWHFIPSEKAEMVIGRLGWEL